MAMVSFHERVNCMTFQVGISKLSYKNNLFEKNQNIFRTFFVVVEFNLLKKYWELKKLLIKHMIKI